MKIAQLFKLILLLIFVTSCSGKSGKVDSKLDITEIKKESLTSVNATMESAPNYNSNKTQPRRSNLGSSGNKKRNEKLSEPSFPITINFKRTKISDGLRALGNLAGKNVIVADNIVGYLNMKVIKEPWNEVFNSIIELNQLSYKEQSDGGIIKILRSSDVSDVSSTVESTEIFHVYYNQPTTMIPQLTAVFTGEEQAPTFAADDTNRKLIVKGTPDQFDAVEVVLNKIDLKRPQILIEAFVLEVAPTFERKLGTRLSLKQEDGQGVNSDANITVRGINTGEGIDANDALTIGTNSNAVTNFLVGGTSGLGIIKSIGSDEIKFEIDALETEGDSKTLSNPKLFTMSGENAVITQGTRFGVNTTSVADGVTTTSVQYFDANLKLDITPTVTGDGTVSLDVVVTNDTVNTGASPPIVTKKEVDTNLFLSDGDIAVVGGILTNTLSESNSRVPLLGKVPILGSLFRSRTSKDETTELLIFLAPRII